jgi:succinate dehydrogenase / fumarate reductase flavoprotein subunit
MELRANVPDGPIEKKWEKHRFDMKLVNPANKRKYEVIVVGSGLAGGSAAATLGELGYNVKCFCYQDSPRRAHSIAAQGGINAAKNYQNDGDSVWRLFYDTVKGGDFRAREANVYRLAETVGEDHRPVRRAGRARSRASTAGLWPTAASAGRRCRAPSTRAVQTGSSSCSAAYQALERPDRRRKVRMFTRHEMLD